MREQQLKRLWAMVEQLTLPQRRALMSELKAGDTKVAAVEIIEGRIAGTPVCPHCAAVHVVKNGQVDGLQRYLCRNCNKTFNALTCTPLARLRQKGKWLTQAEALRDGLTIHQAAERLHVAASTAFRWRHRFLTLPQGVQVHELVGIAEADETFFLRSCKGQRSGLTRLPRKRGGKSSKRGTSKEYVPVLVARDRSRSTASIMLDAADKAHVVAALKPILATDAILCTDGGSALALAAREIGVAHRPVNLAKGKRVVAGVYHVQNVNAYDSRLKDWLRHFHGVATRYLGNYLGWHRALDRSPRSAPEPAQMLALAVGA